MGRGDRGLDDIDSHRFITEPDDEERRLLGVDGQLPQMGAGAGPQPRSEPAGQRSQTGAGLVPTLVVAGDEPMVLERADHAIGDGSVHPDIGGHVRDGEGDGGIGDAFQDA